MVRATGGASGPRASLSAILTGLQAIDPGTLLAAWNMMPGAVRDYLPAGFVQKTGLLLFALNMAAILLRQVKQKKLETPNAK